MPKPTEWKSRGDGFDPRGWRRDGRGLSSPQSRGGTSARRELGKLGVDGETERRRFRKAAPPYSAPPRMMGPARPVRHGTALPDPKAGNQPPHACSDCPRRFDSREQLHAHRAVHMSEKDLAPILGLKWECATCGAGAFATREALEAHRRSAHT